MVGGGKPGLEQRGEVRYLMHTTLDMTAEKKQQRLEEQVEGLEKANEIFMHSPFAIAILKGPDFVVELANAPIIEMWGKSENVMGKSINEVLPENEKQGFVHLMHQVVVEAKPYNAYEMPAFVFRNGKKTPGYYNFSC